MFITNSAFIFAIDQDEISPYKYTERPIPSYKIPVSSRFTANRAESDAPAIVYYLTKPTQDSYPIAILCGGSTTKGDLDSIIHFHRYLLKELNDLGLGVLTVEQWGIDGNSINENEFMTHYTRSQRLDDHQVIIEHLKLNSPHGWNGKLVFLGVSEGGPIVTSLTELYSDITLATINWVGAGDWTWREELWAFICDMRKRGPWYLKLWDLMPRWLPFSLDVPKTRNQYDICMNQILANPDVDQEFMGMTYLYHADALQYPAHDYAKIKTPFLSVIGSEDPMIESGDAFAQKAKAVGVKITYLRVDGMDHYIRRRPDIIEQSFEWLKQILNS
ncbi:MAG: alpha/beta hydrolase [Candidatus Babeliaceae bacterium]